ncbi:MAG TPA: hypothetical protein VNJ08_09405 [Bacteriovoracaceae bacterium]|nr:hypothetical protein [Bacteriovoracaceae bacterium]
MRKFVTLFLVFFLTLSVLRPGVAHAQMPAKARAFLTIVGYGTAGGALLGVASMAFGNSTRAVAQGASLGLYAGLIFGTYVLVSHNQRSGRYEDSSSPYSESKDIYGEGYEPGEGGETEGSEGAKEGFFERVQTMQTKFGSQKRGGQMPPLYLNLLQYNF